MGLRRLGHAGRDERRDGHEGVRGGSLRHGGVPPGEVATRARTTAYELSGDGLRAVSCCLGPGIRHGLGVFRQRSTRRCIVWETVAIAACAFFSFVTVFSLTACPSLFPLTVLSSAASFTCESLRCLPHPY